jgi:hypothetical protein
MSRVEQRFQRCAKTGYHYNAGLKGLLHPAYQKSEDERQNDPAGRL